MHMHAIACIIFLLSCNFVISYHNMKISSFSSTFHNRPTQFSSLSSHHHLSSHTSSYNHYNQHVGSHYQRRSQYTAIYAEEVSSSAPYVYAAPVKSRKVYKAQARTGQAAPINNNIKTARVRLIATNEEADADIMLGIMSLAEAQAEADKRGMDLVLINEKGDPPVCKVVDYGRFRYNVDKRKRENLKKRSQTEIKEVKMSCKIEQHDFEVRLRAVQKFIQDGDRVKVIVQFKGREMQHKEIGRGLLLRMHKPVEDITVMEAPPKEEGRAITMLLGPKKP